MIATIICPALAYGISLLFNEGSVFSVVIAALVALVIWFVFPRLARRAIDRSMRKAIASGMGGAVGEARLTLDDDGLTEELAGVTTRAALSSLDRVAETDDHFFVFASSASALLLPKLAHGAAELIAELRSRLESVGR